MKDNGELLAPLLAFGWQNILDDDWRKTTNCPFFPAEDYTNREKSLILSESSGKLQ